MRYRALQSHVTHCETILRGRPAVWSPLKLCGDLRSPLKGLISYKAIEGLYKALNVEDETAKPLVIQASRLALVGAALPVVGAALLGCCCRW